MSGLHKLSPREAALRVAEGLREAGFETYFAGGCVRDHLLGIEPNDVDVATSALPTEVARVFPKAWGVGEQFGVMLVPSGGRTIEVATFRSDGKYHDGRRPIGVSFDSAEADAKRRDFTINGMFEDPTTGRIIDFVGGRADLEARVLRAIGDPATRFEEDRLRMLRAVRFATRFHFTMDSGTAAAIMDRASQLGGVSRERVGQELRRMFDHPTRDEAAACMEWLGLDRTVLGEARRTPGTDLHRLRALEPTVGWEVALIGWELDRGTAGGVDPSIGQVVDRLSEALVLSRHESRKLFGLLEVREALRNAWTNMGVAARKRLVARTDFPGGLEVLSAESPEVAAAIRREVDQLAETGIAPTPLLSGQDLLDAGLRPGPVFRVLLEAVYDAQLEGRVEDRAAALQLARMLESSGVEGTG